MRAFQRFLESPRVLVRLPTWLYPVCLGVLLIFDAAPSRYMGPDCEGVLFAAVSKIIASLILGKFVRVFAAE